MIWPRSGAISTVRVLRWSTTCCRTAPRPSAGTTTGRRAGRTASWRRAASTPSRAARLSDAIVTSLPCARQRAHGVSHRQSMAAMTTVASRAATVLSRRLARSRPWSSRSLDLHAPAADRHQQRAGEHRRGRDDGDDRVPALRPRPCSSPTNVRTTGTSVSPTAVAETDEQRRQPPLRVDRDRVDVAGGEPAEAHRERRRTERRADAQVVQQSEHEPGEGALLRTAGDAGGGGEGEQDLDRHAATGARRRTASAAAPAPTCRRARAEAADPGRTRRTSVSAGQRSGGQPDEPPSSAGRLDASASGSDV